MLSLSHTRRMRIMHAIIITHTQCVPRKYMINWLMLYSISHSLSSCSLYQVRCGLRVSPRLPVQVETSIPEPQHKPNGGSAANGDTPNSTASDSDRELDHGTPLEDAAGNMLPGSGGGSCTSASIINGSGASRIFQILYRNEEVPLRDIIHFRSHLLGE